MRTGVAINAVDFSKGYDGLAALVKNDLRKEPFTGTVFLFRSKRVYWDETGLVMTYK
jgi:transposase